MRYLVALLLLCAAFLEATFVRVPLVFVALLLVFVLQRETWLFVAALLSGMFIDSLLLQPIGISSMVYCAFLFVVYLYEKKFEVHSYTFVGIATFLGTMILSLVHGYSDGWFLALVTSGITLVIYVAIRRYISMHTYALW